MASSTRFQAVPDRATTLVDSCVLLDILTDDPTWAQWSDDMLSEVHETGYAAINPIIYAEVAGGFDRVEDLNEALPENALTREPLPYEAGFLASKAFLTYRRRGGERRSPLPDFYIGAHAAVRGYRLLTRDAKRFKTYFPTVEMIAPPS